MENERKNNHNILLIVIAAATLIVAMIGATFAYFSATSTATKQQITTGELKINATSDITNNTDIKPTKWDGTDESEITSDNQSDIAVVTLTVNTSGTTIDKSSYDILLTTEGVKLNTTGKDSDGKLLEGGKISDINWSLFDEDNKKHIAKGTFGTAEDADATTGDVQNLKINTDSITIKPNDSDNHIYKLYIWIQDDDTPQNKLQELSIDATLKVEAKQSVIQ